MINDIRLEYDPTKHCCKYWYKDFCDCAKRGFKKYKAESKRKAVGATEKALTRNKIVFTYSNLPNIVEIVAGDTHLFLSLKSVKDEKGFTTYKFRLKGTNEWHTAKRDVFINRVKTIMNEQLKVSNFS